MAHAHPAPTAPTHRTAPAPTGLKTQTALLPLAVALVVTAVVIWFLYDNDMALGEWLFAGFLVTHGWIHLAMVAMPKPSAAAVEAAEAQANPFDAARSWLVTSAGVEVRLVKAVGIALAALVTVGYLFAGLATLGLVVPTDLWAPLVVGSSVLSLVLIGLFLHPLLLLGVAIDVVLIVLVVAAPR